MPDWQMLMALLASLIPLVAFIFALVAKMWPASALRLWPFIALLPWLNVSLWLLLLIFATRITIAENGTVSWTVKTVGVDGELSQPGIRANEMPGKRVFDSGDLSQFVTKDAFSWVMVFWLALLVALIGSTGCRFCPCSEEDEFQPHARLRENGFVETRWLIILIVQSCWTFSWLAADWRWSLLSFDVGWLVGLWGLLIERNVTRTEEGGSAFAGADSKAELIKALVWQGVASTCLMAGMLLLSAISSPMKADLVPVAPLPEHRWSELIGQIVHWSPQNEMSSRVWSTTSEGALVLVGIGIWIRAGLFPVHGWWGSLVTTQSLPLTILLTSGFAMSGLWYSSTVWLPLFAGDALEDSRWWGVVALCGAVWVSCLAISQTDLRKIVGYLILAVQQLAMVSRIAGEASIDATNQVADLLVLGSLLPGAVMLLLLVHLEQQYAGRELDAWGGLSRQIPRWSRMFGVAGWFLAGGLPGAVGVGMWQGISLLLAEPSWWAMGMFACWMILISTLLNLVLKLLWGRERIPALPDLGVMKRFSGSRVVERTPRVCDLSVAETLAISVAFVTSVVLVWLL